MNPAKPVVLDATDVPIQRPTHRNSQRVASSNTHALKTIIVMCITPIGQVYYVSVMAVTGDLRAIVIGEIHLTRRCHVFFIMADMKIMAQY